MKTIVRVMALLAAGIVLSGCKSWCGKSAYPASAMSGVAGTMTEVRADRMLVWKAYLAMHVWDVSNAVNTSIAMVQRQGGFVEQKSDNGEESANLTFRVPSKGFNSTLATLETLGTVTRRNVQGEDVTEQYIDVDARLKNKIVLRDQLKQLLEKATAVKDVLAIETELNRVQADIDSMEGRIKALKGQVDYATVNLSLEREPILGPLGYLCKGLWWGVEKLFVIRE